MWNNVRQNAPICGFKTVFISWECVEKKELRDGRKERRTLPKKGSGEK